MGCDFLFLEHRKSNSNFRKTRKPFKLTYSQVQHSTKSWCNFFMMNGDTSLWLCLVHIMLFIILVPDRNIRQTFRQIRFLYIQLFLFNFIVSGIKFSGIKCHGITFRFEFRFSMHKFHHKSQHKRGWKETKTYLCERIMLTKVVNELSIYTFSYSKFDTIMILSSSSLRKVYVSTLNWQPTFSN